MHKSVTCDRTRIKEKRKKGSGFLPREYYEMNYICRTCDTESLKSFYFCNLKKTVLRMHFTTPNALTNKKKLRNI